METFYIITLLLQSVITLCLLWAVNYQRNHIKNMRERLCSKERQLDEVRRAYFKIRPTPTDVIGSTTGRHSTRGHASDSPDSNASSAAGASA